MADSPAVFISTLGCDKNTVDSEQMAGGLLQAGYRVTDEPNAASLIIVNTCCFIEAAKKESIDKIFEYLPFKTRGNCECFVVAGCMAQRYAKELRKEIPEIDYFIGVNQIDDLPEVISYQSGEKAFVSAHFSASAAPRYLKDKTVTAYLKISEGCDNHCTYCAIPTIRGRHHSRTPEAILAEAKILYSSGVRELILVAQNLTQYGSDLPGNENLASLLTQLSEKIPFKWIRLLYLYPEGITEELLTAIKHHENICRYFDMPIQHTENEILKRMGRHIDKAQIYDKVKLIRKMLPDAVLRTTVITGFPGESEAQFEEMLADLQTLRFERLGAFAYSREEGTPAYTMADQIDETVKKTRLRRIYEQQQGITAAANEAMIGKTVEVLIDENQTDGVSIGRTRGDAPEVDCDVLIEQSDLPVGQFFKVKIIDSIEYDLIGELGENEFTE